MTRFMFISQWVLLAAIFAFAFRHSYRAHRITRFTALFTWALLAFHAFVFSFYGMSVGGSEANDFPDGTHIMAFLLFDWFDGLIIGVLAVGSWRAFHGVPLFKNGSRDEKPDA
jgi:hypothetical protein